MKYTIMTSRCIVFNFERDSFYILQLHRDPLQVLQKKRQVLNAFFFKAVKICFLSNKKAVRVLKFQYIFHQLA